MRARVFCLLIGVTLTACVGEDAVNTGTAAQDVDVSTGPTPVGQQDPVDPGDRPMGEESLGSPLPAPVPDPAMVAAQKRYTAVLRAKESEWESEGIDEAEKNARRAQLKSQVLGGSL